MMIKVILPIFLLQTVSVFGGHRWYKQPQKNLAELLSETPSLSTLLAAVQAAGLAETFTQPGPFTVFAPSNDAFAKIPAATLNGLLADKEALTAVLLRHVLAKKVPSYALAKGDNNVSTVGGDALTVNKSYNGVTVTSAAGSGKVIAADIKASNGVVHVIDSVI